MRVRHIVWAVVLFGIGCGSNGNPNADVAKDPSSDTDPTEDPEGDPAPLADGGKPPRPDGGKPDSGAPDSGVPDSGPKPVEPEGKLAEGVTIAEVAIYQAVKISLSKGGAKAARTTQVVSNRDAFVRVYVSTAAPYHGQSVTAELRLTNGGATEVLKASKTITAASTEATLASTFNFQVPKRLMTTGVTYSVAVTDPAGAGTQSVAAARYPATGTEVLDAKSTGDQLKVVLVPFQYNNDGSGRLPDTTPAQITQYKNTIYGLYPAANVDVTVHAAYPFSARITADGTGFDDALDEMVALRAQDRVAKDVYYYGIFSPAATMGTFCRGGCVAGLSGLGTSVNDAGVRASVGIGFVGASSAETAAHEIGHAHGRQHSPGCGAAGADRNYPNTTGLITVYGYDIVKNRLISTTGNYDFMSYCTPTWISDYNYNALFTRMKAVNGARVIGFETPRPFQLVSVRADGALKWGHTLELDSEPSGEERTVEYVDESGTTMATALGHFYPYDHLPGGFMIVPETPARFAKMRVTTPSARAEIAR